MFHLGWFYEQDRYADIAETIKQIAAQREFEATVGDSGAVTPTIPPGNFYQAMDWYRRAAEKGYAPAMNNLGQLYLDGLTGQRDATEAFRWHLAAAKLGNYPASINVSLAYLVGEAVARDDAEAKRWEIWTDSCDRNAGISELVLARSNVGGTLLSKERQTLVRAAAAQKVPMKLTVRPMQPDPRIPTFREVREKLGR